MHRAACLLLFAGGCYAELGLGARSDSATVHGSFGIQVELGDTGRAAVRAGAGGAIGRFHSSRPAVPDGDVTPGNVVIGAIGRVLGTEHHALAVNGDLYLPFGGAVYTNNFDDRQAADIGRAYVGVGYRHGWTSSAHYQHEPVPADDGPREAGSFAVTVGPEVFWTRSSNLGDSRDVGAAASVTFAVRGWAVWHAIDCLFDMGSKSPDEDCSS